MTDKVGVLKQELENIEDTLAALFSLKKVFKDSGDMTLFNELHTKYTAEIAGIKANLKAAEMLSAPMASSELILEHIEETELNINILASEQDWWLKSFGAKLYEMKVAHLNKELKFYKRLLRQVTKK